MLNKYQIDPTCLEIEITEEVCLEDTEQVINLLNKIRSLGIRLALDDLGKGYSSLQYLVNFPFDTIKIDRSFVADLEVSKERRVVIQSILDICKKLGKRVVAEGSFTELSLRNYFNKIVNKNEF
ncbi:EAL domain-containing protein [Pallidibacillus pasinlerensis]|uniref:EAL domain-containing protein n=1 Tax=Pallidibacillus pasinlerensis TaxID=2703818 RepID=A0ABX0A789_9BACI|nr:EAL domain-containing protein [Pallidibacillus pasinlerensis]NCU17909.1 EAL domain-containing protein [Pallidibacillus pasinlerensis]